MGRQRRDLVGLPLRAARLDQVLHVAVHADEREAGESRCAELGKPSPRQCEQRDRDEHRHRVEKGELGACSEPERDPGESGLRARASECEGDCGCDERSLEQVVLRRHRLQRDDRQRREEQCGERGGSSLVPETPGDGEHRDRRRERCEQHRVCDELRGGPGHGAAQAERDCPRYQRNPE